jgi:hypothetical protein
VSQNMSTSYGSISSMDSGCMQSKCLNIILKQTERLQERLLSPEQPYLHFVIGSSLWISKDGGAPTRALHCA